MAGLKIYNPKTIYKKITLRKGEVKFGEKVGFISNLQELQKNTSEFVLFGIPEDIGVRANYGKSGTSNAWGACLSSLLNTQNNHFFNPENLILLGEIDCTEEMKKAANLEVSDPNYFVKLGELVEKIDEVVSRTVKTIISAGKIPIIIGGGHNNAFGNIKGASEALENPINVLNIDAHTDLRRLEHRHSGNGFSYAKKAGFLNKYFIFGLQQNYTPEAIYEEMDASAEINYVLFEDFMVSGNPELFEEAVAFVNSEKFGLEIDCDAMANFPSSAISPSGFLLNEVRNFIKRAAKSKNCLYLHLCEAVATKDFPTGKALAFFITDFLKAKTNE